MLHLLKQKSLFRRSLCMVLIFSLCCIPLFGFSRADYAISSLGDGVIADDMLAEAAGVNLDEPDTPKPPVGFPSYEYYVNYTHSFYAGLKLREAGIDNAGKYPPQSVPCHPAFGGVYFDRNNGLLVINIVDDDAQLKEEITRILKDYSGYYYFRSVTYSLNYLYEISGVITEYMIQNPEGPLRGNIVGWGHDEVEGTVCVRLLNPDEEVIAFFKENITDSPVLIFKQGSLGTRLPRLREN